MLDTRRLARDGPRRIYEQVQYHPGTAVHPQASSTDQRMVWPLLVKLAQDEMSRRQDPGRVLQWYPELRVRERVWKQGGGFDAFGADGRGSVCRVRRGPRHKGEEEESESPI